MRSGSRRWRLCQLLSCRPNRTAANKAAAGPTWLLRGVKLLRQTQHTGGAEIRRILRHWADYAFLASGYKEALANYLKLPADEGVERQLCLQEIFRIVDRTRILTLVRDGPWGCNAINDYLQQYLRLRLDRPGHGLFHGALILVTRNDRERQLFNGDVGIALQSSTEELRVVFVRQGTFLSYPVEALPAHELGFALTVHKSQGSEYAQVLLVFPPVGGRRLLTRELVYTGITRAKKSAISRHARSSAHRRS